MEKCQQNQNQNMQYLIPLNVGTPLGLGVVETRVDSSQDEISSRDESTRSMQGVYIIRMI